MLKIKSAGGLVTSLNILLTKGGPGSPSNRRTDAKSKMTSTAHIVRGPGHHTYHLLESNSRKPRPKYARTKFPACTLNQLVVQVFTCSISVKAHLGAPCRPAHLPLSFFNFVGERPAAIFGRRILVPVLSSGSREGAGATNRQRETRLRNP